MANRHTLNQFQYTFEKDTVTVYGKFNVGTSGAVDAYQGGGVASVVKESTAGQYTINFKDKYSRFLEFSASIVDDAISQVAKVQVLMDPATVQATVSAGAALLVQCLAIESDATPQLIAANPASGAVVFFKAVFRNTTVGPFDA